MPSTRACHTLCPVHVLVTRCARYTCSSHAVLGTRARHTLCPVHVLVAHVVDEVELEALQPELSCRGRQRSMGDSPEDIGVDEAPEDILPPTPASTPNTVVGSHLVELIHTSLVGCVRLAAQCRPWSSLSRSY